MRRLALVLFLFGCGSNDSTDGVSAMQAMTDCRSFSATFCAIYARCNAGTTEADCLAALATGIDCSRAVGESGSFAACKTDIGNTTCAVLNDPMGGLPASCKGLILHN